MPTIHIIPATPDHAARIHDIIARAFEQYRELLNPPSSVFKETIETIHTKLSIGGGFIARINDQDAGSVIFEPKEDHMYLGRLAVLPDFRHQGVARALIHAVEDQARAQNFTSVHLGVRLMLEANRQLFTSLGYEIIEYGTHDGFTEPTYVNMAKTLSV